MFFKKVELSRHHWSARLLYWVFPSLPHFTNFCPFLWLFILATICSPFIVLWKTFIMLPGSLLEKAANPIIGSIGSYLEKHAIQSMIKRVSLLSDEELYAGLYKISFNWNQRSGYYSSLKVCTGSIGSYLEKQAIQSMIKRVSLFSDEELYAGLYKNSSLKVCTRKSLKKTSKLLEKILCNYMYAESSKEQFKRVFDAFDKLSDNRDIVINFWAKNSPKAKIPISSKPWWSPAVNIVKWFSIVLVVPIGFLIYEVARLVGWLFYWLCFCISKIGWMKLLVGLAVMGATIVALVLVILCLILISIPIRDFFYSRRGAFCKFMRSLFYVLGWPFRMFGKLCILLWHGLKTFKANNCPELIWKD